MLLLCGIIKMFENELSFLLKEINIISFYSIMASNLYNDDTNVMNENIELLDFYLYDSYLYVKPINKEILLPVNGLVTKINHDSLVLSTNVGNYKIYTAEKSVFLYQYYKSYTKLGNVSDYYVISGDNLSSIVSKLMIVYEKV